MVRQTHPVGSVAVMVAVVINIVAIAQEKYANQLGFSAVFPLAFLLLTGLYLFVLPHFTKWRSGRRSG